MIYIFYKYSLRTFKIGKCPFIGETIKVHNLNGYEHQRNKSHNLVIDYINAICCMKDVKRLNKNLLLKKSITLTIPITRY